MKLVIRINNKNVPMISYNKRTHHVIMLARNEEKILVYVTDEPTVNYFCDFTRLSYVEISSQIFN
jgi:hypothetical protein